MTNIAFSLSCLTDLRYEIPFSYALNHFFPDIKQFINVDRRSDKYNGIKSDKAYETCVDILKQYCPWASLIVPDIEFDFVVQVEVGNSMKCKKRISIQHGFDCALLFDRLANVDAYICGSKLMYDFAIGYDIKNALEAPLPVQFWDSRLLECENNGRYIFVFYPDSGDISLASDVIKLIEAHGLRALVKQRRKHQSISGGGTHVYDDIWYPSEAVILPLQAELVIGFGSSAYTDLVPIGVNYINVDIHHDKRPWNSFSHPLKENYTRITSADEIHSCVTNALSTAQRINGYDIDDNRMLQFITELLK